MRRRVAACTLAFLGLTACDQAALMVNESKIDRACEEVFLSHFVNPKGIDLLGSSVASIEYPFEIVKAEQEEIIAEIDSESGKRGERKMLDIIRNQYDSGQPYMNNILTIKYGIGSSRSEFLCSTVDDGKRIEIKELVFEGRPYRFMDLPFEIRSDLQKTSFIGEIE